MDGHELSVYCHLSGNGTCRSSVPSETVPNGFPRLMLSAELMASAMRSGNGDWADPDIDTDRYLRVSQGKEE